MLAAPLDEIRDQAKELQQATGSVDRIAELFQLKPRVIAGSGARLPAGPLSVAFEDVSFAYDDESANHATRNTQHAARSTSHATSPSTSRPDACWVCWDARAAGRQRSQGCSSGSMTRPRAPSGWAAPICAK
jgi:ABC-type multidrug transport system fused ATPase/permease subunit